MDVQHLPKSFYHYSNPLTEIGILAVNIHKAKVDSTTGCIKPAEIKVTLCGKIDCSTCDLKEFAASITQVEGIVSAFIQRFQSLLIPVPIRPYMSHLN